MITIVGGGPGGRTAAVILGLNGEDVTLIEQKSLGGQCLRSGCMFVCGLIDAARIIKSNQKFKDLEIFESVPVLNFPKMMKEIAGIQKTITSVLKKETHDAGVEVIYGEALVDGNTVSVNGENIESENIILSTGSKPFLPGIPGISHKSVYTTQSLPSIQELPERLVILGGGVTAAEFAFAFSAFGSEVTIITRSRFLSRIDGKLQKQALSDLVDINIRQFSKISLIKENPLGLAITVSGVNGDNVIEADAVILAAGLLPNSEPIQNVPKGLKGEIIVNKRMQTQIPGVYACGDVIGPPCLTPVARKEGYVAAQNILNNPCEIDYSCIPQSISLSYDLAFCSEETKKGKTLWIPGPAGPGTFFGVRSGSTGCASITYDNEDGTLKSVESVSPGSAVPVSYLGHLIKKGISVQDFLGFNEVHPIADGLYGLLKWSANSYIKEKKGRK